MADEKQQTEERQEPRDMTGWSEEEIERGETFIDGFIRSCKEAKAMREGRIKGQSLEDFFAEMEALAEEVAKEDANGSTAHARLQGRR